MKTVKQLKTTTVAKAVALTLGVLSASAAMAGTVAVPAYDLGLLKNFNIVAGDSIHVRTSDMQCGVAARNNLNVFGGYSIGTSNVNASVNGTTVVSTFPAAPLGILLGQNLNWQSHITAKVPGPGANVNPPSGTINGDVFFSANLGAMIAPDASVTLAPGKKTVNLSTLPVLSATTVATASYVGFAPAGSAGPLFPGSSLSQSFIDSTKTTAQNFRAAMMAGVGTPAPAYPATGTTVARTFNNASATPEWPIAPNEARYNIDLTDVVGNTARGIGPAPAPWTGGHQLYVFDVDAAVLSGAQTVRLNNVLNFEDQNNDGIRVPASDKSSWVVIRVTASNPGTTVRFGSMGMQDLAGMASRVLWVFSPNVSIIQIGGTSFEGSIIAPEATVESLNGQFNGTMFVNNFQGPAWSSGQLPQPKAFTTSAMTTEISTYPGTLEGHCAVFEGFPGGVVYTP